MHKSIILSRVSRCDSPYLSLKSDSTNLTDDRRLEEYMAQNYDTPTAIAQLSEMLSVVDSAEHLKGICECEFYERARFNKAAQLLPFAKQLELRSFAQKLNEIEGEERPSSYLEKWQKAAGQAVKVLVDNAGASLTKIGKFLSLELVNMTCLAKVVDLDGKISYYQPWQLEFDTR